MYRKKDPNNKEFRNVKMKTPIFPTKLRKPFPQPQKENKN